MIANIVYSVVVLCWLALFLGHKVDLLIFICGLLTCMACYGSGYATGQKKVDKVVSSDTIKTG